MNDPLLNRIKDTEMLVVIKAAPDFGERSWRGIDAGGHAHPVAQLHTVSALVERWEQPRCQIVRNVHCEGVVADQ